MPATVGSASAGASPAPGETGTPAGDHAGDFVRLARLAARVLKTPAALVTLVYDGEERVLAGTGLREALAPGKPVQLTPLLHRPGGKVGPVALRDVRLARPGPQSVFGMLGVVAFLACPLFDGSGTLRGTLAVLDFLPRSWVRDEVAVLCDLALFASHEVELRQALVRHRRVSAALQRAERALSGMEHFRGLAEQPLAGLFTMQGGRIRWANKELGRILGYTPAEMMAMEAPEDLLVGGEDRDRLLAQVSTPLPGQESVHVCTTVRRRDATTARVEMRLGRIEVAGRPVVVGAVQEISDPGDGSRRDGALREEAARYRRVFVDDLSGVVIAAPDCRILACNHEFARIAGFSSPEAAVGVELTRLEPEPGEFAAAVERLRRDGGETEPHEMDLRRRDGVRARVVAKLAAAFGPAGEPREVRAYLVDVTQRALREEAMRQSEERLHLLELATNDVMWDWDLATGRMSYNGAGPRRFRYAPGEVRPSLEWHFERIHPEDRERVVAGLHQAITGIGEGWTDEYRFLRGDGSYATVYDRAYVVRNARGEPVRVAGWMADVTERKRNEESQRFLARASALLDSALDVELTAANVVRLCIPTLADFCTLDLVEEDGSVRRAAVAHVRPSRERLLDPGACVASGADAIGNPVLEVARGGDPVLCAECTEDSLGALDRALGDGNGHRLGAHSYMVVPVTAHEQVLAVLTLGLAQSGRRYAPIDLMVARDLAQRAALAMENARLYQTAQRALRAREEVLGVVSHDLRGPLSTIVTTAVLLSETGRERREETRKWLDVIRRSADQMNTLIGDLLDVSSIEAGRFSVDPARHDLAALLADTCEQFAPLAEARGLSLVCDPSPGLPPVWFDERQLVRVLANLLGNALKFTPEGGTIHLGAAFVENEVRVSVSDTGPGVPAELLDRVFDRFWKGRQSDRRGAGLGLTIARGIVEAHGGRIWAESHEGAGSTFRFAIPLRLSPEGPGYEGGETAPGAA
jgi:PAS domain S-box-containing protein